MMGVGPEILLHAETGFVEAIRGVRRYENLWAFTAPFMSFPILIAMLLVWRISGVTNDFVSFFLGSSGITFFTLALMHLGIAIRFRVSGRREREFRMGGGDVQMPPSWQQHWSVFLTVASVALLMGMGCLSLSAAHLGTSSLGMGFTFVVGLLLGATALAWVSVGLQAVYIAFAHRHPDYAFVHELSAALLQISDGSGWHSAHHRRRISRHLDDAADVLTGPYRRAFDLPSPSPLDDAARVLRSLRDWLSYPMPDTRARLTCLLEQITIRGASGHLHDFLSEEHKRLSEGDGLLKYERKEKSSFWWRISSKVFGILVALTPVLLLVLDRVLANWYEGGLGTLLLDFSPAESVAYRKNLAPVVLLVSLTLLAKQCAPGGYKDLIESATTMLTRFGPKGG